MESLLLNFLPVELVSKVLYQHKGEEHPLATILKPVFNQIQNCEYLSYELYPEDINYVRGIKQLNRMEKDIEQDCEYTDGIIKKIPDNHIVNIHYYPEGIDLDEWLNGNRNVIYFEVVDFDEEMKEVEEEIEEQIVRLNEGRGEYVSYETYECFPIHYYENWERPRKDIVIRVIDTPEEEKEKKRKWEERQRQMEEDMLCNDCKIEAKKYCDECGGYGSGDEDDEDEE